MQLLNLHPDDIPFAELLLASAARGPREESRRPKQAFLGIDHRSSQAPTLAKAPSLLPRGGPRLDCAAARALAALAGLGAENWSYYVGLAPLKLKILARFRKVDQLAFVVGRPRASHDRFIGLESATVALSCAGNAVVSPTA